jgi:hypothetical protein
MSKIFRQSSCQKASAATERAHRGSTGSSRANRACRFWGRPHNFFLDADDRLGTGQAQRQTGIVALQLRHRGGERVGLGDLRATPGRRQCAEGSGVALPAPVGQSRGVDTLAAQHGTDPPGLGGAIGLGEDAQLVLGGEGPPARAIGQFR